MTWVIMIVYKLHDQGDFVCYQNNNNIARDWSVQSKVTRNNIMKWDNCINQCLATPFTIYVILLYEYSDDHELIQDSRTENLKFQMLVAISGGFLIVLVTRHLAINSNG